MFTRKTAGGLQAFFEANPMVGHHVSEIIVMREFHQPYSEIKRIQDEEPLKWEFWKAFLTEEGIQIERNMKKNKDR